ncbi:PiggyBac transposable element-derived protein 4 [Eumeta japonica]|uniref:PiggyBac transposable element-derived protein 4 n=1 Tax=Eumeta variegata TaxID=151549 RepID=A0A4C1UBE5_EUMVA|nr:PiggyBac transposable element-derived protein 4 [Eumeta japonica]
MDPRRFYGGIHTIVKDFPDSSADEDLSDDEQLTNRRRNVLPPLCIPESEESESDSDDNIPISHLASLSTRTSRAEKPRWRDGFLERAETDLQFTGDISLPLEITALNTPYQFFKYLFTDDIFLYISQETNKYAVEKRPEKPSNITVKELEQFIGICLYMSIVQLPSTRFYWNEDMGYPKVSTIMSCNRFEEIKRFIHFNDNLTQIPKGQPGYNPLHKIQPLLELLRQRILTVPKEQYMAVDEQIIPTKSRSSMRQYNPKKPHKWGYKTLSLAAVQDLVLILKYILELRDLRTLADSDPYLPLADFKCAVAEGLSQSNKPSTSGKRGRPSYELENAIEAKKLRGPIAIMPSRDVRLDQIDHMPLWTTRQRCKVPECNGRRENHRVQGSVSFFTLLGGLQAPLWYTSEKITVPKTLQVHLQDQVMTNRSSPCQVHLQAPLNTF